jgi:hypothetical protein
MLALLWAVGAHAAQTHQGQVVKAGSGKLTMADPTTHKRHTMKIPADATITRGGTTAKLTDLKPGDTVTVTTEKKQKKDMVTTVEATPASS